jgi:hypothetical protein
MTVFQYFSVNVGIVPPIRPPSLQYNYQFVIQPTIILSEYLYFIVLIYKKILRFVLMKLLLLLLLLLLLCLFACFFLTGIVGGVESKVHSALRPPVGLLWQPRMIMMGKMVEWLAEKTEVLGENLPQCRFVHHKSHMLPEANPGSRFGKLATNRLSFGTPLFVCLRFCINVYFLHCLPVICLWLYVVLLHNVITCIYTVLCL